ncbi:MAG: efflux RND transporter permease subunit [Myxococcota bacterium]|nr:efflux RND transporter permease subunit [Myxococcota bacterium]
MRLSDVSIERPVLATVMSLLVLVGGAVSFFALPVREYPDVDRPVVSVRTVYAGASPATVEATVTEPIEEVLNSVDGIRAIESTSSFGRSTIDVEFVAGRDVDLAATDVTNAVQRAVGQLPDAAERPVVAKAGANAQPIMWLWVKSDRHGPADLTDIADRVARTPLQILPGVARVLIGGERRYAMRVWLDPEEMALRRVDPRDVAAAIRRNNVLLPAGELEGASRKLTLDPQGILDEPRAYADIVLREDGDAPVRLGDVARVELGAADVQTITRYDGDPIVGLGIVRQSRANELAVSRRVRAALPDIRRALPEGVSIDVAVDNTIFVEASLAEVAKTIGIAFAVVVLVNLLFLHSGATTTIAGVAIPVSLVGSFGVMQVLGFSVNVLTLLALVLAIGLLVDDAIVVIENAVRRQELGEEPLRAARNGTREVALPVLATTASIVAVLVPLGLMGGNTGRLFREFAIVVAGAVMLSTFVALTLVPTLCARLLEVGRSPGRIGRGIDHAVGRLRDGYGRLLGAALRHGVVVGLLFVAVLGGTVALWLGLPATFVPVEDRGRIAVFLRAPEGSTTAWTDRALREVEARMAAIPEMQGFFSAIGLPIGGVPSSARGVLFARLEPWGERDRKQQAIVAELAGAFSRIPEALVFPLNPPSLGARTTADLDVVIEAPGVPLETLDAVTQAVLGRVREIPGLVNVDADLRLDQPEAEVVFDREGAEDLGVPVEAVFAALQLLVAQGETDEFVMRGEQYDVITAVGAPWRTTPERLTRIHLRARDGSMVPISSVVRFVEAAGPATLNRYDLQRASRITASLLPGATLDAALAGTRRILEQELPEGFGTALAGSSRDYVESAGRVTRTFGVALLVVFLVLAAQFESFVHPLTVMLAVPMATLGGLAALGLTGQTVNLYSQIGMVLLVGLVTKNAILLVDFANQARARGADLDEALREAGHARFRPILMTSTTSILGTLPLALATGAGAESRRPIGIVVIGGLLFSTLFTLVMIPVLHRGVTRLAERLGLRTVPPALSLEGEEAGGRAGGPAEAG